jgi:hypothetical protein
VPPRTGRRYGFPLITSDADDRKSVGGYVLMLNGGAISWNSKLQTTVAISTMEAEYMAMCATMQEGVFLRQLLKDMNFEQTDPTDINEDNTGTISLAKKPVITNKSKHIDIKFHFVREKVEEKVFRTPHVGTDDMVADAFTKAINQFMCQIGESWDQRLKYFW